MKKAIKHSLVIMMVTILAVVMLSACSLSGGSKSSGVSDFPTIANLDFSVEDMGNSKDDKETSTKEDIGTEASSDAETSKADKDNNKESVAEHKIPVSALYYAAGAIKPDKLVYDDFGNIVMKYEGYVSEEDYRRGIIYTYDNQNNLVSMYYDYTDRGDTDIEWIYTYDEKNRLIKEEKYAHNHYESDDQLYESKVTECITHTYISDTEILHEEGPYKKWTEYLDEYGNPLKYNSDERTNSYTYDSRGNIVSVTEYTRGSDDPLVIYYEYDDENRIIKEIREAWGNKAIRNMIYEGDLLIEVLIVSDSGVERTEYAYTYDEYGNMIKEYSNIGGTEKENKWEYTYE